MKLTKWQKSVIKEISDERSSGDGIWVYLKNGLLNDVDGTHCIHEDTWEEVFNKLYKPNIVKCNCQGCIEESKL